MVQDRGGGAKWFKIKWGSHSTAKVQKEEGLLNSIYRGLINKRKIYFHCMDSIIGLVRLRKKEKILSEIGLSLKTWQIVSFW